MAPLGDPDVSGEVVTDLPPAPPVPFEDSAEDLYEHAPCGYLSMLPDGTIVRANQTFLAWTGYERSELVGRRFQELFGGGGRIYYETHYAPLLRMQGRLREIAVDIVAADGRRLPALVNAVVKTDDAGQPSVVRTSVFDATERREYERELLRARQRAEESEARATVLARTLQDSLIPPAAPRVPGLDVAGAYRPAGRGDEVGGDFYDVFETGRGEWAVVVGDVCGKGAEAATVTALARYTIRAAAMRSRRPKVVLRTLNEALLRQGAERFCTVVYARVLALPGGRAAVTLASGGHPLPLHAHADGTVAPAGRAGTLLGVVDSVTLLEEKIELGRGDVLAFYTDGVTEARRDGEFYGDDRLAGLVAACRDRDAGEIASAVVDDVLAFQSGLARDDMAVVVVKATPAALSPPQPQP